MRAKIIYPLQVYKSENISDREYKKLRRKLWFTPGKAHVYLIIRGLEGDEEPLFVVESGQLVNWIYDDRELRLVGIAKKHEDALELVRVIYQDCLTENGNLDIINYLDHLKDYYLKYHG